MKFNILLLVLLFLINTSIISCFQCDPEPPHFEITGLQSKNMRSTNSTSYAGEVIDKNEVVNWNEFVMVFDFQVNYIATSNHEPNGSLMALDCDVPGYAGDKVGVDTLLIQTVYDYNDNYSAGDIINPIVLTNDISGRSISLQEYIMDNTEGIKSDYFRIKLNEAPTPNSQFAIQLTYKLNNGEEFDHITETVILE